MLPPTPQQAAAVGGKALLPLDRCTATAAAALAPPLHAIPVVLHSQGQQGGKQEGARYKQQEQDEGPDPQLPACIFQRASVLNPFEAGCRCLHWAMPACSAFLGDAALCGTQHTACMCCWQCTLPSP